MTQKSKHKSFTVIFFEHDQMVNRPQGVVDSVMIAGKFAVENGELGDTLGKERMGRPLRNKHIERNLKGVNNNAVA